MPDKTSMFDRTIPVLASMWVRLSKHRGALDELYVIDPSGSLVKFGQPTDRLIQADVVQEAPSDK